MSFFKKMFGGKSEGKSTEKKPAASSTPANPAVDTKIDPPNLPQAGPAPGAEAVPSDPHRPAAPHLDHILGFQGRKYAELGDFKGLDQFYRSKAGDDATIIVSAVTNSNDFTDRLEEWGYQYPDSPTAQLFCGENFNWRAWEARGGRLAKEVSGGQWEVFGTWLGEAEKHLTRARELDPRDPEPWYRSIGVLLGQQGASTLSQPLLDNVLQRHPYHLSAVLHTLTHTLKKWGGTHEAMNDFARRIHTEQHEGSPLHAVVAAAVLERSVYYIIEDDYDGANAYLRSADAQNFVWAAYQKSIGSGKLKQTSMTYLVYNYFACAHIYSNLKHGKDTLELMGDQITDRPWAYFGNPVWGHVNDLRKDFGFPLV